MRSHATVPSLITLHLLWLAALLSTLTILLLTGCGVGRIVPPSAQPGASIHGVVHGGQQPVAGAHVYLFAANTTGYGGAGIASSTSNASIDLLQYVDLGYSDSIGVYAPTAADGSFDITGDYTCTPGQQVYLYVHGGNPGGGTNSAAGFLAILGNCPAAGNLDSIPYVEVNEVSTVAAAYAFAAFASDPIHVSTNGSPQALTGIANAFATASNLVDLGSGTALTTTPAGNGTVPQATLYTLANILASCVNSADNSAPLVSGSPHTLTAHPHNIGYSSPCISLGEAVSGGNLNQFVGHTYDTATAAIFIAQNPGANIAALYALPVPKPPFGPALTTQPNDFTLSVLYTGAGINKPIATAIDSSGNVWIADRNNTVDAITSLGAPLSGTPFSDSSISSPQYIAVDPSNNVWITNIFSNSVSCFTNAGAFSFKADFSYSAAGLAIDNFGNAWIPNANGNDNGVLTEVSPSGTPTSVLTGLNFPQYPVIDNSGNLWFGSVNSIGVTEFYIAGSTTSGPFTAGGMSSATQLAVDSSGNLWGLEYNDTLIAIDASGNALSGPPYNSSSSGLANTFILDGQNNFWIANHATSFATYPPSTTYYLSGFSSSGTALVSSTIPTPVSTGPFPLPVTINSISIDASGNLWVPAGDQVIEYIGIATPIETPMAQAIADNCIAQRPCFPPG